MLYCQSSQGSGGAPPLSAVMQRPADAHQPQKASPTQAPQLP